MESVAINREIQPGAVDAPNAAKFCGVGETLWHEQNAQGLIPEPVRIGRRVVWPVDELRAWLLAGAPPRRQWEVLKKKVLA